MNLYNLKQSYVKPMNRSITTSRTGNLLSFDERQILEIFDSYIHILKYCSDTYNEDPILQRHLWIHSYQIHHMWNLPQVVLLIPVCKSSAPAPLEAERTPNIEERWRGSSCWWGFAIGKENQQEAPYMCLYMFTTIVIQIIRSTFRA